MGKNWNEQQAKAITLRNKNILVSASAGSGKTGVLIQRFTDLIIKDRIQITEILAMTFSEAAANEMKKRLSNEITQRIQNETNPEELAYLNQQLTRLTTAYISTIHSFCLSILQNYYYVIDCSLKRVTTIFDDAALKIFQKQALDQVMDEEIKKHEQAFIDLNIYLNPRAENDEQLRTLILKLADMASSQIDPQAWFNQCIQAYKNLDFLNDAIMTMLQSKVNIYIQTILALKQHIFLNYGDDKKKPDAITRIANNLDDLKNAKTFDEIRSIITHTGCIPLAANTKDFLYTQLRETKVNIEDEFAEMFDLATYEKDNQWVLPILKKLIFCTQRYMEIFENLKIINEGIDFSDMEHLALQILKKNDGAIAKIYREQLKIIMVDEFQDSNDVQDELVHLIARENNVFRVGDVKQSIYGFRHALPQIMQGYKRLHDEHNECIVFNKNYRSSEVIVEFNNVLFKELMNIHGFDTLPFVQDDIVSIGWDGQKKVNEPIVFHLLDKDSLQEQAGEKINADEYKASYIANQILKIKEEKGYRYSDFCVLLRGNQKMEVLKKVFDEINLPYYMESKTGFYNNPAIQSMLSVLKLICNPRDEISAIAMLSSAFFQFSNEQLAQLKLAKTTDETLFETFIRLYPQEAEDFKTISSIDGLCNIISAIYSWHHFYDSYTNEKDRDNLDLFFEKAMMYEKEHGNSCSGFITYIKQMETSETAQARTLGKDDDVVQFMTIHKSKGLEYPVVFLWSSSKMVDPTSQDLIISDHQLGLGFKFMDLKHRYVHKSLQRLAIEHKLSREYLEEEMRILYVATTRAKNEMHIIDFIKDKDLELYQMGINESLIYKFKGTTSWILASLMNLNIPHLFRIQRVYQLWSNKTQEKIERYVAELPCYTKETTEKKFTSPSELEHQNFEMKPLNFKIRPSKRHYGRDIHALVEHLPKHEIDETIIRQCAESHHIELYGKMIQECLNLYEQPLFKKTFNMDVHHEFPFQVMLDEECSHGFMDYVAFTQNEIILFDFKSDRNVDEFQLRRLYTPQLKAYQQALKIMYPHHQIHTYLYSFDLNQAYSIE